MGKRKRNCKDRIVRHERRLVPKTVGTPDLEVLSMVFLHSMFWLPPTDYLTSDATKDTIHLDWLVAGPTPERPFQTLITAGMSTIPMISSEYENGRPFWAELVMLLPPDWPLDRLVQDGDPLSWPLHLLSDLGHLPHLCDTVLWLGHTSEIMDGGPLTDDCPFPGAILGESDLLPEEFHTMRIRPGKEVRFLCVLPLTRDELEFAKRNSPGELIDRLSESGLSDVVDVNRESVLP